MQYRRARRFIFSAADFYNNGGRMNELELTEIEELESKIAPDDTDTMYLLD